MKAYIAVPDFSPDSLRRLRATIPDVTVRAKGSRPSEDELLLLVDNYDVLVIGARERMTQRVHKHVRHLKILGTLSVAVDHIDDAFHADPSIAVLNCPTSNTISVAEHTFALILALVKKLRQGHTASVTHAGRAGLHGLPSEIDGRTIGVVGAGPIGARVLTLAAAFRMRRICYTPHPEKHADLSTEGVEFVTLPVLFRSADVVTIHLPLTETTRLLISPQQLDMLRPHSVFINTSRTEVVDTSALIQKLRDGTLLGVGIDGELGDDLLASAADLPALLVTPHVAGVTNEAIARMDSDIVDAIVSYINSSSGAA